MPVGRRTGIYLVKCESYLPVYFLWKYRQAEIISAGKMAKVRVDAPNAHLGSTSSFTVHAKSNQSANTVRKSLGVMVDSLQQATLCIDARYTCRPILDHLTSTIELHCACVLNVQQNEPGISIYCIDIVGDIQAVKSAIRYLTAFGFKLNDERRCSLSKEPDSDKCTFPPNGLLSIN